MVCSLVNYWPLILLFIVIVYVFMGKNGEGFTPTASLLQLRAKGEQDVAITGYGSVYDMDDLMHTMYVGVSPSENPDLVKEPSDSLMGWM